jgi:kumamolisin
MGKYSLFLARTSFGSLLRIAMLASATVDVQSLQTTFKLPSILQGRAARYGELLMTTFVELAGSSRSLLPNSVPAGAVDHRELASLTIRVASEAPSTALLQKAYEIAQAPLAQRTYLSHDQVGPLGNANSQSLNEVERYGLLHNLMVVHRSTAERHIVLRGSLGDLLAAFPTDLQFYHHPLGTYRGRRGPINVPQNLQSHITGIFGFDTRPKHRGPGKGQVVATAGPGGDNGVVPTYFATRYNFPTQYSNTNLDGTGQTIAIIELGGGFTTSDLQTYFQEINSPMPSVAAVSVDYAGNNPTTADSDDGEVMLDIEVIGAVVPAAMIVVYFAPNSGDQGLLDALSAAVNDTERKPSIISISWGNPEDFLDPQAQAAYHEIFAKAVTLGITVCAASGDHGVADMASSSWDQHIHVDHPASDDLVLGCGGTQIDAASNQETVWNDGTPFNINTRNGGGWASGGGISTKFQVPAYQGAANLPLSIVTGQPGRGVPDIAMSATSYFVRVDSQEYASGGTSAVAPLMSALVARLNQAKQKRVGFLNTFLYANAINGVVRDITVGTNGISNTVVGYQAGPGWDACTGLGTPDGAQILNLL